MIVLAARSGLPVVPVGLGFTRAWRVGSWDRFAVPKLFSTCVCVIGEAIHVPPRLDRDGLEAVRRLVEERMLAATSAAERVARGGLRGPRRAPRGAVAAPARPADAAG
jgi:lysophospholipid acyltransferase (LPLAT)-like uncharacterized protein